MLHYVKLLLDGVSQLSSQAIEHIFKSISHLVNEQSELHFEVFI